MNYKRICIAVYFPGVVASAAAAVSLPPPGSYQIDSRATQTVRFGPTTIETEMATDGANGDVTQTSRSPSQAPVVSRAKGAGPVRWCVSANRSAIPSACLSAGACSGAAPQWQQIDARTWQVNYTRQDPHAGSGNAPAAVAQARSLAGNPMLATLPPAERAALAASLASLPDAAAMNRQNLETAEAIERDAARLPPAEAAILRGQAARLREGTAGEGMVAWQVTERWTRVNDRCSP